MHDGSAVRFRKTRGGLRPDRSRRGVRARARAARSGARWRPGLLFIDENGQDMHAVAKTVETPLVDLPFEELCPGNDGATGVDGGIQIARQHE